MTSPNKRVEALTSRTLVDYLVPSKASELNDGEIGHQHDAPVSLGH